MTWQSVRHEPRSGQSESVTMLGLDRLPLTDSWEFAFGGTLLKQPLGRTGGRGNGGFLQTLLSSVVVGIQFRAWKQALNLGKALNRKSNPHHLQALVLTGMIAHQLGMNIARRIGNLLGRARLSYE